MFSNPGKYFDNNSSDESSNSYDSDDSESSNEFIGHVIGSTYLDRDKREEKEQEQIAEGESRAFALGIREGGNIGQPLEQYHPPSYSNVPSVNSYAAKGFSFNKSTNSSGSSGAGSVTGGQQQLRQQSSVQQPLFSQPSQQQSSVQRPLFGQQSSVQQPLFGQSSQQQSSVQQPLFGQSSQQQSSVQQPLFGQSTLQSGSQQSSVQQPLFSQQSSLQSTPQSLFGQKPLFSQSGSQQSSVQQPLFTQSTPQQPLFGQPSPQTLSGQQPLFGQPSPQTLSGQQPLFGQPSQQPLSGQRQLFNQQSGFNRSGQSNLFSQPSQPPTQQSSLNNVITSTEKISQPVTNTNQSLFNLSGSQTSSSFGYTGTGSSFGVKNNIITPQNIPSTGFPTFGGPAPTKTVLNTVFQENHEQDIVFEKRKEFYNAMTKAGYSHDVADLNSRRLIGMLSEGSEPPQDQLDELRIVAAKSGINLN